MAAYETAAVFRRELAARRHILMAGLACAALVVILPLVPVVSDHGRSDIVLAASFGLALGAGIALSVGLGASILTPDLCEGRLGFYFERPVSSTAIWLGKFSAALLLIVLCEATILAAGIAWLAGSSLTDSSPMEIISGIASLVSTPEFLLALAAPPTFILLVSHCVSIMLRVRSAWLALDLIGLSAATLLVWFALRPLIAGGFDNALNFTGLLAAAAAFPGLLAGTASSLALGRTDRRRTHRALSLSLWPILLGAMAGVYGYSTWLQGFGPSNLTNPNVIGVSPDGSWIEVEGAAEGHLDVKRRFLISSNGQRELPLPVFVEKGTDISDVAADGSRAAWLVPAGDGQNTLWTADLRSTPPVPLATTIAVPEVKTYEISPDGTSIAFIEEDESRLLVFDLVEEQQLIVLRLPEDNRYHFMAYTSSTNLRLMEIAYEDEPDGGRAHTLTFSDLPIERSASPVQRTSIRLEDGHRVRFHHRLEFVVTGFLSRWVDSPTEPPGHNIFDARGGSFIKDVRGTFGGFLPGDRYWSLDESPDGTLTFVVDAIRGESRPTTLELGLPTGSLCIGAAGSDSIFLASEQGPHYDSSSWYEVEVLDLDSGRRLDLGKRLEIYDVNETAESLTHRTGMEYIGRSWSPRLVAKGTDNTLFAWSDSSGHLVPIAGKGAGG